MGRLMHTVSGGLMLVGSAFVCFATVAGADGANGDVVMDVNPGTVSFEVATNVPALRVHGKSNSVTARARLGSGPKGVVLEQIEASVPVRSLETGLALRDEHMRKYIFTTTDGQVPDVQFSGERAECPRSGSGQRTTCTVSGALAIRGTARPFVMALTINEENGVLRVSGHGIVRLSAYGIDQPSQLGVRTTDEVKLKLVLSARRSSPQVAVSSMRTR
jgi:polyisoprenoid-binding protein YceI